MCYTYFMSSAKVENTHKAYSRPEELTNFITYAVAAALSFVGLVFLLVTSVASGSVRVGCFSAYTFAAFVVFTLGALGHILPAAWRFRTACKKFERCSVAALTLGAFAPILLTGLASGTHADAVWGYVLFSVIAACAVTAITLNSLGVSEFKIYVLALYVVMGWACVIRIDRIIELCGWTCFWLLIGGGAAFFIGKVICAVDAIPARHTVWHVFAVCGATLWFVGLYTYIL